MATTSDKLVWIDCEMTGLDLKADALIEVAVLVTDAQLNILGDGVSVVIKPEPEALTQMDDFVRNMHINSGLLDELDAGTSMENATAIVMDYIKQYVPEPRTALLAGNSVGTDKNFLERDMPELIEHLHYRIVDVSTIKELSRRWYPDAFASAPVKDGNHRALGDIEDSIEELRYYRSAVMVPQPGPSAQEALQIAREVSQG